MLGRVPTPRTLGDEFCTKLNFVAKLLDMLGFLGLCIYVLITRTNAITGGFVIGAGFLRLCGCWRDFIPAGTRTTVTDNDGGDFKIRNSVFLKKQVTPIAPRAPFCTVQGRVSLTLRGFF